MKKTEQHGSVSNGFGDDNMCSRSNKRLGILYIFKHQQIAYHRDKLARGFEKLINIWGADHHGYIPRTEAAIFEALGNSAHT